MRTNTITSFKLWAHALQKFLPMKPKAHAQYRKLVLLVFLMLQSEGRYWLQLGGFWTTFHCLISINLKDVFFFFWCGKHCWHEQHSTVEVGTKRMENIGLQLFYCIVLILSSAVILSLHEYWWVYLLKRPCIFAVDFYQKGILYI